MKQYCDPICPITCSKANIFCSTEGCTKRTFACRKQCLQNEGHFQNGSLHQFMYWSSIEEIIANLIQLPLSKEQLQCLEKQRKQLKIMTEQLNLLYEAHEKMIIQCKKRLSFKGAALKVFTALKEKTTSIINGGDMAELVKAIKSSQIFSNIRTVTKKMEQRHQLTDQLIATLRSSIEQYKVKESGLIKPELIPLKQHIIPNIDVASSNMALVNKDSISVKLGTGYRPIFARQTLNDGQSFTIQVVQKAMGFFMIGLATADLRDAKDKFEDANNFCINACSGRLYLDGSSSFHEFQLNKGDKITVQRSAKRIEWLRDGKLLCSAVIPSRLEKESLYPVLWICSAANSMMVTKLRFV